MRCLDRWTQGLVGTGGSTDGEFSRGKNSPPRPRHFRGPREGDLRLHGRALRWEALDEDILVEDVVAGRFPRLSRLRSERFGCELRGIGEAQS